MGCGCGSNSSSRLSSHPAAPRFSLGSGPAARTRQPPQPQPSISLAAVKSLKRAALSAARAGRNSPILLSHLYHAASEASGELKKEIQAEIQRIKSKNPAR